MNTCPTYFCTFCDDRHYPQEGLIFTLHEKYARKAAQPSGTPTPKAGSGIALPASMTGRGRVAEFYDRNREAVAFSICFLLGALATFVLEAFR